MAESIARYAKLNKVRFKSSGDRKAGIQMFNEFFKTIEKDMEQKMTGHIILEGMSDPKEAIVLTLWETKDHMDRFYLQQNRSLANLVEGAKPLFEKMPERIDYEVSELHMIH